jgi:SAM-dependent methyltransferase
VHRRRSTPGSAVPRNVYSRRWFDTFLGHVDAEVVASEVAFLQRQLPLPDFRSVLDLACGTGRHAAPLTASGYDIVGLDLERLALERARRAIKGEAQLVQADMRSLPIRDGALDAVVCLWQSFGYFDPVTNRAVLAGMLSTLRRGGRCVLDLYNRDYFASRVGRRELRAEGVKIIEDRKMIGTRLRVRLRYEPIAEDEPFEVEEYDWELFAPRTLIQVAESIGLAPRLACAGFDESRWPTEDDPRMQLVFERG